jgi:hypothetical protein
MENIQFSSSMILARAVLVVAASAAFSQPVFPQDQETNGFVLAAEKAPDAPVCRVETGALMRAEVANHVDWSHVPKGSVLEGKLKFPLYAGEQVAVPAGTALRVTVASSEKVRDDLGFWRKTGHAIVRAFNPLEKNQAPQYRVTLEAAELLQPSGAWVPVDVSVVRAGTAVIVSSEGNGSTSRHGEETGRATGSKNKAAQTMLLRFSSEFPLSPSLDPTALQSESAPAGHRARAYLLTRLSASESREGDKFQAQLAEPVLLGDRVFAPGSLLEGTVVRSTPPRMLSRAGKLHLRVDGITAQDGSALHVSGNLSQAEADKQARFFLDEEGTLRGRKPGIKSGLVDLGLSYALGKVSDDLAETPIRALGASMSDAAVANAARYVGIAGAVTFLVTRRGRDVRLPKYAEIEVDFGRVN